MKTLAAAISAAIAVTGSKPLTLVGFVLLAGAALAAQFNAVPTAIVAAPLALLALNLAAGLVVHEKLRRGGLGLFHVALLALLLLAGWGRLTHFNGRVEVAEGTAFEASQVMIDGRGPWHDDRLALVAFTQGPIRVDYAPRMKRAATRSEVLLGVTGAATTPTTFGDDQPLVIEGYRFYTTHNKGFAPLLTWQAEGGTPVTGALHLPAYPLRDWQQDNAWTAPDGTRWQVSLRLDREPDFNAAWTLDAHQVAARLQVEARGERHLLRPGDSARVGGASLRFDGLRGWMGYVVFHDPTLRPMFVAALLGVLGLALHLWPRIARLAPLPALPAVRESVTGPVREVQP